jgi:hypothetical protein
MEFQRKLCKLEKILLSDRIKLLNPSTVEELVRHNNHQFMHHAVNRPLEEKTKPVLDLASSNQSSASAISITSDGKYEKYGSYYVFYDNQNITVTGLTGTNGYFRGFCFGGGGGGGGGGCKFKDSTVEGGCGGGGGGGGASIGVAIRNDGTYPLTVGQGGNGGAGGVSSISSGFGDNGENGGTSKINILVAPGGTGGEAGATFGVPGAGGAGGSVNVAKMSSYNELTSGCNVIIESPPQGKYNGGQGGNGSNDKGIGGQAGFNASSKYFKIQNNFINLFYGGGGGGGNFGGQMKSGPYGSYILTTEINSTSYTIGSQQQSGYGGCNALNKFTNNNLNYTGYNALSYTKNNIFNDTLNNGIGAYELFQFGGGGGGGGMGGIGDTGSNSQNGFNGGSGANGLVVLYYVNKPCTKPTPCADCPIPS